MTHPLGRVVEHDERSRDYPAMSVVPAAILPIRWAHYGTVLDQGDIGACTGFAMAQCLNSGRLHEGHRQLGADDALALYSSATRLDSVPGHYPPDDTGSSGLAVAKAAKAAGYIRSYTHAFGLQHLLGALQLGPVIVGTNWYEGMDTLRDGFVSAVGSVRGGHEWVVLGWQQGFLTGLNSWGPEWGLRGTFHIRTTDMDQLLHEHGDVTVPVR